MSDPTSSFAIHVMAHRGGLLQRAGLAMRAAWRGWRQGGASRLCLSDLDDHMLSDIGASPELRSQACSLRAADRIALQYPGW
ncbi:DUF1127 domain-containing protein [Bordetella sp. 2513F-2]